ncbi:Na(+)/H(+) antiporter subunit C [Corynebacterium urogenitale]|uniref:Na(+)/H(+) antiporter subunit C n=1 Tax=Corynebacterium urogenitale TaxID=2487892 RepID=A0A5J6ZC55_9CORY|nr:cation:proton antiporter subunit C [Corynebacterium urogenitale]QFQ03295.1 Na(+)/H(+) antiporter subunit C [Corynebacterium urogenitale]
MIIAAIIAILIAGGVYMIMQRGMFRLIVGLTLLSHGVNLLILAAGIGAWRFEPLMDRATTDQAADPLPQAFVLTAIVISMASTAVMLVLAALGRDDDTRTTETPERSAQKLRALQTMGREAGHIDPDSTRATKRTQRDDAARGANQHYGPTTKTSSTKGESK